jgi:ABC-2 type transport system permease protein
VSADVGAGVVRAPGRDTLPERRSGLVEAVRMEWVKLRSLRSTVGILLVTLVATIGIGVTVLAAYPASHFTHQTPAARAAFDPTNMGLSGTAFAILAFPILGTLLITSEYASGLIAVTLTAVPGRRRLLLAKALVLGAVLLVLGEIATFTIGLVGNAVLTPAAPHFGPGTPGMLRALALTGVLLALLGLLGLGLGAIIRHTAGAIATVVGLLYVTPAVVAAIGGQAGLERFGRYLPMLIDENSTGAVIPVAHALSPWAGVGLVALYAAVALGLGGWMLSRRDA